LPKTRRSVFEQAALTKWRAEADCGELHKSALDARIKSGHDVLMVGGVRRSGCRL
jgi:hypothetical protein